MKVIDLLNKIAKWEEVPNKIITLNSSFEYNKYDNDYYCGNTSLFTELVGATDLLEEVTPVEIIEEDNKIEHIMTVDEFDNQNDGDTYLDYLADNINELIDEVNKLKEK